MTDKNVNASDNTFNSSFQVAIYAKMPVDWINSFITQDRLNLADDEIGSLGYESKIHDIRFMHSPI